MEGPLRRRRSPSAFVVKLWRDADAGEAAGCVGWVVGADRAAASEAAMTGWRCRGSCSCCIRGGLGASAASSASAARCRPGVGLPAWQEAGAWQRLHLQSCTRPVRSNGGARARTGAMCKRKKARKRVPAQSTGVAAAASSISPRRQRHPAGLDAYQRQSQGRHSTARTARSGAAGRGRVGRPRRPDSVVADRGYDTTSIVASSGGAE
jgi:hypothetical protein